MAENENTPQPVSLDAAMFAVADAGQGASASAKPAPKKAIKRNWIAAGIVAAVVVVAGAGLWAWHETPSFCGSLCHSPMDAYVDTYYSEDPGMLASAHAAADETCLSCHEPKLTEQVGEAMKWIADDYPMTADGTMLVTGVDLASEEFCATSGCHSMTDVVAQTWGFEENDAKYNPHSSHQDLALTCGDCHKAHETSVLVCNECHSLNMPEGWEAPNAA